MKNSVFISTLLLSVAAQAQSPLAKKDAVQLTAACEQQVVDVVFDKLGRFDETFGVIGYKIIYRNFDEGLVVVRTSDEVEPRDVLASYDYSSKSNTCAVKYKETLADGSTADLDDELIAFSQEPKIIPAKHFVLDATVISVVTGEIDPFLVGDACVMEVQGADGQVTGIITDQYDCDENADKIKVGAKITLQIHKSDQIRKKAEVAQLREMFKASRFFNVPFEKITVR